MRFPMFFDIENKKVLVIGGGRVGCRRIEVLKKFSADITLISDTVYDKSALKDISFINRKFKDEDIKDYFMVIASTNDRAVNHRIYEICSDKNIFVSVCDCLEESSFYFPAVCMGSDICVGVVSDGKHHDLVRETAEKIRGVLK